MKKIYRFIFSILLLLSSLKGYSQSPVLLTNYDFNTGSSFATFTPYLLSNVSCAVTSTQAFITYGGVVSGANAFTSNATAGNGLGMANSSGTNTNYFTFTFSGSALQNYTAFKFYCQAQRSSTGATTLTLAYSTNGTSFTNFGTTKTVGTSYTECAFDLSAITTINNPTNLYIRLMASGASSTGTLRIDNFQMQGVYSVASSPSVQFTQSFSEFVSSGIGTPSADQAINISGTSLTNDIVLTAPAGFEIYNGTTSSYGSTLTLAQSSGTVANTRINIRYNPSSLSQQPQTTGTQLTIASTGVSTQTVDLYGIIANLTRGDIAMIGINSSTTDMVSFVTLKSIPAGTIIRFTDNGYSDSLTQMVTEGIIQYTAPSTLNAGTVVTWTYGMSISGTGWNVSSPTSFSLTTSGDQLFAYQGNWGVNNGTTNLLAGYNFGNSGWTTTGTVTSVTANSYKPAALTSGYMSTSQNNLYFTNTFANVTRTPLALFAASYVSSNWTLSNSALTFPTWSFNLLADEPITQASFSAPTYINNQDVTLNFNGGSGSRCIVFIKKSYMLSSTPTDGLSYTADTSYGAGSALSSGEYAIYNGTVAKNSVTVGNLTAGTKYYVSIFSYNGTGNASNYLTSPLVIDSFTTSGSAGSFNSTIITDTTFSYASMIDYKNYQATNIGANNHAGDLELGRFIIQDGGGSSDGDPFTTTLDSISFSITNSALLRRVALYDDTTEIAEMDAASTITFKNLNYATPDDGSRALTIRGSFQQSVTDTLQVAFTIRSAYALPSGSMFSSANGGGAGTSISGNNNRIDVVATKLVITQQPVSSPLNAFILSALKVAAQDINNNKDLNFNGILNLTTTGTLDTVSVTSVQAFAGAGTFSFVKYSAIGTGITMEVSATGVTSTGNSNAFDIYKQAQAGDAVITEIMYNAPTNSYEWMELHNTTPDTLYISNWYITDAGTYPPSTEGAVTIPAGTYLLPYEYRVVSLNGGTVGSTTYDVPDITNEIRPTVSFLTGGIALSNSGDNLALYTAATNGILIDGSLTVNFGNKGSSGVSIERYNDSAWTSTAWAGSTQPYTSAYYTKCTPAAVNKPIKPSSISHLNVSYTSATVRWSRVSGITKYQLDISADAAFTSILASYNSITVTDTFKNVTGLNSAITYYARVRSFSPSYFVSDYTSTDSFTTLVNNATLSVKAMFEGCMANTHQLLPTLNNSDFTSPLSAFDTVQIRLVDSSSISTIYSAKAIMDTAGVVTISVPGIYSGNRYYIVVNHRNHVETWSSYTVPISGICSYDFTQSASSAYGSNLWLDAGGLWLIYGGDINQDGVISNDDMVIVDNDNSAFASGYILSDINGDGTITNDDIVILDNNNSNFISSMHP